jgi:hypothetical protein
VLSNVSYNGTVLTGTCTYTAPTANVNYVIEFFASSTGDAEGAVFLSSETATPAAAGKRYFQFTITTPVPLTDPVITATITDASGETSAFSNGAIS